MSTAKWRNGSKSFLACSVPNLELDVLSFDIHLETPTRCVGKHFPQPPHHFLRPEAPHISMSKLHLFWGQTKAGSWKTQRLTIDMIIDASQVTPMVMSLAEHHLTHSKHTTTRRVRFSTCIKSTWWSPAQLFPYKTMLCSSSTFISHQTSRPSHMFCSKAFICKLQQQTGLSNSSISNLFAQLMSKSSMRHVSLGSIGHVGISDVFIGIPSCKFQNLSGNDDFFSISLGGGFCEVSWSICAHLRLFSTLFILPPILHWWKEMDRIPMALNGQTPNVPAHRQTKPKLPSAKLQWYTWVETQRSKQGTPRALSLVRTGSYLFHTFRPEALIWLHLHRKIRWTHIVIWCCMPQCPNPIPFSHCIPKHLKR